MGYIHCHNRPSFTVRLEDAVLDQGSTPSQVFYPVQVVPELAVGLDALEIIENQPCARFLLARQNLILIL